MSIPKKNALEWAVFGIGLALLLSTVGYLVADALGDAGRPPQITATLGDAVADGRQFRVAVRVANSGDAAAQQVEVEVSSADESASLLIDLLPGESVESGTVYFQHDPRPNGLRARVVGYLVP